MPRIRYKRVGNLENASLCMYFMPQAMYLVYFVAMLYISGRGQCTNFEYKTFQGHPIDHPNKVLDETASQHVLTPTNHNEFTYHRFHWNVPFLQKLHVLKARSVKTC